MVLQSEVTVDSLQKKSPFRLQGLGVCVFSVNPCEFSLGWFTPIDPTLLPPSPVTLNRRWANGYSLFQSTQTQLSVFYGGPLSYRGCGIIIRWGVLGLWRQHRPTLKLQYKCSNHLTSSGDLATVASRTTAETPLLQTSEICAVCYFGLSLLSSWHV